MGGTEDLHTNQRPVEAGGTGWGLRSGFRVLLKLYGVVHGLLCNTKSMTPSASGRSNLRELFLLGLPHDLFQQIDVAGERFASRRCQRVARQRPSALERLRHRQIPRLVQGADMRREVAAGHGRAVAELGERE